MTSSLQIGKVLYAAMSQDSAISAKVGNKIYPIVAPTETILPFIVYSRVNSYPVTNTKDGWLNDDVSFQIVAVSDNYFDSVEIADAARDVFENTILTTSELRIENIRMTSCTEAFNDDEYIQTINFNCDCIPIES